MANDVSIAKGASFIASISHIYIGNKVIFGPNVIIRGGVHSSHIIGKLMVDYHSNDKLPTDDKPVVISNDVWVGPGAIILSGVHIGRGAIIAGLFIYLYFLYQIGISSYNFYQKTAFLLPILLMVPIFGIIMSIQILTRKIGWIVFAYIVGTLAIKQNTSDNEHEK